MRKQHPRGNPNITTPHPQDPTGSAIERGLPTNSLTINHPHTVDPAENNPRKSEKQ